MNDTAVNDDSSEDQAYRVKRFANNSIRVIWIAGIGCMLIFIIYFLILPAKAENRKTVGLLKPDPEAEALFTDKTTLVNIGLRMQEIVPVTVAEEKPVSNIPIRINKIIYDKKNKTKKLTAPDFFIKAVPK